MCPCITPTVLCVLEIRTHDYDQRGLSYCSATYEDGTPVQDPQDRSRPTIDWDRGLIVLALQQHLCTSYQLHDIITVSIDKPPTRH